jgi:hypothetical protein
LIKIKNRNSIKKNLQYVFCTKKIERIKHNENIFFTKRLENNFSKKDNSIRIDLNSINFYSKKYLLKKNNSKNLNGGETKSIMKNLIKFNKFGGNSKEGKKSDLELNNINNRSDIKNLILDSTPIEINMSNTLEKYKLNNCNSKINFLSKFKSCRIKGNSKDSSEEFVLSNQQSKSKDFLNDKK